MSAKRAFGNSYFPHVGAIGVFHTRFFSVIFTQRAKPEGWNYGKNPSVKTDLPEFGTKLFATAGVKWTLLTTSVVAYLPHVRTVTYFQINILQGGCQFAICPSLKYMLISVYATRIKSRTTAQNSNLLKEMRSQEWGKFFVCCRIWITAIRRELYFFKHKLLSR